MAAGGGEEALGEVLLGEMGERGEAGAGAEVDVVVEGGVEGWVVEEGVGWGVRRR